MIKLNKDFVSCENSFINNVRTNCDNVYLESFNKIKSRVVVCARKFVDNFVEQLPKAHPFGCPLLLFY